MNYYSYSDLIYEKARDDVPKAAHRIFQLDAKGALLPDNWRTSVGLFVNRGKQIGIRSGGHYTVDKAAECVRRYFEPVLFPTGEDVTFDLEIRVVLPSDSAEAQAMALAHWHPHLNPMEHFFSECAEQLRIRLEASAETHHGTIDQRIAANRVAWETEIASWLTRKFQVALELRFRVDCKPPAIISLHIGKGKNVFRVGFSDRMDKRYPFAATVNLLPEANDKARKSFPRSESGQRDVLRGLLTNIINADITLYDYWFDPVAMERTIHRKLEEALQEYGQRLQGITIDPSSEAGIEALVTVETAEERRDDLQQTVTFRAGGNIEVARDGAGLYDRNGRPEREQWFQETLRHAFKKALTGASFIDLNAACIQDIEAQVERSVKAEAEKIGLHIRLFFGKAALPYQDWKKPRRLHIANREYVTAHPKISAHFSMDAEVAFDELDGIRDFITKYLADHPGESMADQQAVNKAIEERVINTMTATAEMTMKKVVAADYFARFSEWQTPIGDMDDPAASYPGGESKIRQAIEENLAMQCPGLSLRTLVFHRTDDDVEALRNTIAGLSEIPFQTVMGDHKLQNKAMDRILKGHVYIAGGDPECIVDMLNRQMHEEESAALKKKIAASLNRWTRAALERADHQQLDALIDSFTICSTPQHMELRERFVAHLERKLQTTYGLMVQSIDLWVDLPEGMKDYKAIRAKDMETVKELEDVNRRYLIQEYKSLTEERSKLTGDDIEKRMKLNRRITEIETELGRRSGLTYYGENRSLEEHTRLSGEHYIAEFTNRPSRQNPGKEDAPADTEEEAMEHEF